MKSVLVVEDDSFFAQRIAELLGDNGTDCQIVDTPEGAIDALASASFDAVLIDVMLPNFPERSGISDEEARGGFLTGVALARRLRHGSPLLPILLFSNAAIGGEAYQWAQENDVHFISKTDGPQAVVENLARQGLLGPKPTPRAFIVHGHDDEALLQLKDYLQNTLKWQEPIVLRDQPSGGKTIIEKFENVSGRVDFVFVLLTPDDQVLTSDMTNAEKRRSRQNVIFEFGFFYGKLGRESARVIALRKGSVELPSDIDGIVWIDISNGVAAAGEAIRREATR
jgi:predicted nucleotide-binding protein